MRFFIKDIIEVTEALGNLDCFDRDVEVKRIVTDSRIVEKGDLFVCLIGKHFDGHSFAYDAVKRGAVAVLGEKFLNIKEVPYLLVKDSLVALGNIARFARKRFKGKVIAITGSSGKTTVKEFIASVLSTKFKVGKTYKNWNNELGVPLSIFRFNGDEDFWVLELGISKIGDMDVLGSIVLPDIAVFLNIGVSHTEGLGDYWGVLEEKTKLLRYLDPKGLVLYNKDAVGLESKVNSDFGGEKEGFSTKSCEGVRFCGRYLGIYEKKSKVLLFLDNKELEVELDYLGEFIAEDAVVAGAIGHLFGIEFEDIKNGLKDAKIPEHRNRIIQKGEFFIIDDCYNANPLSMRKSIKTAWEISKKQGLPLILVLGDMKELGKESEKEHVELGKFVKDLKPEFVFYYGDFSKEFLEGFKIRDRFRKITDQREFKSFLHRFSINKGVVLFKGSRECELERFIDVILER